MQMKPESFAPDARAVNQIAVNRIRASLRGARGGANGGRVGRRLP